MSTEAKLEDSVFPGILSHPGQSLVRGVWGCGALSGASVSELSVDLPWWKCPRPLVSFGIKDLVLFLPGSLSVGVHRCLLLALSSRTQGSCTKQEQVTGICWIFFPEGDDAFQLDL